MNYKMHTLLSRDDFLLYYEMGLLESLYIRVMSLRVNDPSEIDIDLEDFNLILNGNKDAYEHYH